MVDIINSFKILETNTGKKTHKFYKFDSKKTMITTIEN